ncbi:MAG: glycoside hydrolase family 15, partial [Thermoleophilia bacterium]|nr:glycoside hydrolase family 15 [Thermoleophilia bacterium]
MYERSLLTLRALTDSQSGAVAAWARDGWAYVWPRDAATAALAFATAGYRAEARRVASFLAGLDLTAGARFHGDG